MIKKTTLDIESIENEFSLIREKLFLLNNRFIALAMDYKHYIDSSFKEDRIYTLRDNTLYRLSSANFHIELLLNHLRNVENNVEQGTLLNNRDSMSIQAYLPLFSQQITSLFDSFIYHTVSVFDYLGTLTNYIGGSNKEKTLMWTQLAKSVRDKNNCLYVTKFSKTIDKIDREFVCKLYDHRASLIHRKADFGGYNIVHSIGYNEKVQTTFYAGKDLIKSFKELQTLSKENDLTMKYVSFWVLNETIDRITDVLFSLKEEMEANSKDIEPTMFFVHPETKEKLPASVNYWNEKEYQKK